VIGVVARCSPRERGVEGTLRYISCNSPKEKATRLSDNCPGAHIIAVALFHSPVPFARFTPDSILRVCPGVLRRC
jgi:hypothetical protein